MSEAELTHTVEMDGWVVRQRQSAGPGPHPLVLMLHGWTGDENAMWVFAARLPKGAWLMAPRGPYAAPLGGYGWHPIRAKAWPWVDDFYPTLEALRSLLSETNFPGADLASLRLVGFSQGAALAYSYALSFPSQVRSLAGLSGFLPDGATALARDLPLKEKPVFIAHGTQDELVPVERARQAVEVLQAAGAKVSYCEDHVGHKLSADCFRGMQAFFERY